MFVVLLVCQSIPHILCVQFNSNSAAFAHVIHFVWAAVNAANRFLMQTTELGPAEKTGLNVDFAAVAGFDQRKYDFSMNYK